MLKVIIIQAKNSCSSLSCESDAMRVEMNPMLFGLTEPRDLKNSKSELNKSALIYILIKLI